MYFKINRYNVDDYIRINKEAWNKKTEIHFVSDFYNNKSFLEGESTLKSIELDLLTNIEGKTVLHLQCHFGQDSISLARMGAKVTGVDLSDKAIEKAKELAFQTSTNVEFICSNIFDLPQHLDKQFDIVFTSYGVIGWLPDLNKWASIISKYLKPGGKFVIVEFHPFIWMFDSSFKTITYNYFNSEEIHENNSGSYADRDADIDYNTITWNHSIGEIINSLINNNIEIKSFDEYDYSVYNCFDETVEIDKDKYRIKHFMDKIPMTFSLEGIKKYE